METLFKYLKISLLASIIFGSGCNSSSHQGHDDHGHHGEHGHHDEHEEEAEKGPHGGRLLSDGDFAIELQIFEEGVPPHFRVYAYFDSEQLALKDYRVEVKLTRLGGVVDQFNFKPVGDFLTSDLEVREPHSFDVEVSAEYEGHQYKWSFESHEGRTVISNEVARLSGIKTENASSRVIKSVVRTRGKILPSEDRIAHVIPRFSGVVRESKKHIGDKVEKGELLAVIESNESLQPYEIRSQISGTIVNGHLVVGEFIPENQWVYIVADLSQVWADFFVPLREQLSIQNGQKVIISSVNGSNLIEGAVSYVAPYADDKSQSQLVRAIVQNKENLLLPGMFVTGDLVVDETKAEVAVKKQAIQSFRDWKVVFAKVKNTYEIKPLSLGKSDGEWIEVLEGLDQGEEYVTENAFIIKADILKSGASHDH